MNKNLLESSAIIEADSNANDWPTEREIEQSKAISLKRIADAMEEASKPRIEVMPAGFETVEDKRHREWREANELRHREWCERVDAQTAIMERQVAALETMAEAFPNGGLCAFVKVDQP